MERLVYTLANCMLMGTLNPFSQWFWGKCSGWVGGWVGERVSRSFGERVFPVNHLHWYWQPNKNNQVTEHTNNTTEKESLVNNTTPTS